VIKKSHPFFGKKGDTNISDATEQLQSLHGGEDDKLDWLETQILKNSRNDILLQSSAFLLPL